jgi:hypothetical protein
MDIKFDEKFSILENSRLKSYEDYKKKMKVGTILIVIGALLLIIGFFAYGNSAIAPILVFIGIPLVVVGSIFSGSAAKINSDYSKKIKLTLLEKIITEVYGKANYQMNAHIGINQMMKTGLYSRPDRYRGEDYISGTFENVNFETSELTLERRVQHTDSKGHTYTTYEVYFSGQYFVFRFPRVFNQTITIREGLKFSLFNMDGLKKIETESMEFNKKFYTRANDEQFFFYIMTPLFMERLMKIEAGNKGSIAVYLHENELHIGIDSRKNKLEFSIKSPLTKEGLAPIINDVSFMARTIDDLRLSSNKFQLPEGGI